MVKVIASSVRKGNVLDIDGKLCVVMKAENIHPGKGTPVTHLDMRRISDGVKITERYRTTEQVERAYLEEKTYNYLFEDDMGFTLHGARDLRADRGPQGHHRRPVGLSAGEHGRHHQHARGRADLGRAAAGVMLEIVETEPIMKGQTASSSFKPAILSNGLRVMVPPHIAAGTRVVDHDRGRLLRRARQGLEPERRRVTRAGLEGKPEEAIRVAASQFDP